MTFFSRFHRLIAITYGVVFLCAFVLFSVLYKENHNGLKTSLRLRLVEQTQALDYLLRVRYDAVNGMRLQAEDFIKAPFRPSYMHNIALQNASDKSYFHLDKPTHHFQIIGNITGLGTLDKITDGLWEEIYMSYALNPLFKVIKENIKTSFFLRYTSKKKFQNLYPWRPSREDRFHESFLKQKFFLSALPENNPNREIFWTDAFLSSSSDELMQTCSAPVYKGITFQGAKSVRAR